MVVRVSDSKTDQQYTPCGVATYDLNNKLLSCQTFQLSLPLSGQLYIQTRDCLGLIDSWQHQCLFYNQPSRSLSCFRMPVHSHSYPSPIPAPVYDECPLHLGWRIYIFHQENCTCLFFCPNFHIPLCASQSAHNHSISTMTANRGRQGMGRESPSQGFPSPAHNSISTIRLYGSPITHSQPFQLLIFNCRHFYFCLVSDQYSNKKHIKDRLFHPTSIDFEKIQFNISTVAFPFVVV